MFRELPPLVVIVPTWIFLMAGIVFLSTYAPKRRKLWRRKTSAQKDQDNGRKAA